MVRRLVISAVIGLCIVPASAAAEITCSYLERGPEGVRWNALRIEANGIEDQAAIVRRGERITVSDDRDGAPVQCAGRVPTIRNIDTILFLALADGAGLFVSQAGGAFAPGARPERDFDEIEIDVSAPGTALPGNLGIGGTSAQDQIRLADGPARPGFGLNAKSDGDPDVVFSGKIVGVVLRTGSGKDLVNASRFTRRRPSLTVYAGGGSDLVFGGPEVDLIFGRRGNDIIRGGPGADEIDCGPGNDFARLEPRDRATGCERSRAERALAFP